MRAAAALRGKWYPAYAPPNADNAPFALAQLPFRQRGDHRNFESEGLATRFRDFLYTTRGIKDSWRVCGRVFMVLEP